MTEQAETAAKVPSGLFAMLGSMATTPCLKLITKTMIARTAIRPANIMWAASGLSIEDNSPMLTTGSGLRNARGERWLLWRRP
jgi:hypothetical protein